MIATIAKTAEKVRADMLLVGAYGLKVEKGDAEGGDDGKSFSVMGSTSDGRSCRVACRVRVRAACARVLCFFWEGGGRGVHDATMTQTPPTD